MKEIVIVRQNSKFETEILTLDPHAPDDHRFHPVEHVHHLTPYGMLLAGLGSCTAITLHTYAQHHGVDLREVELRLRYDRVFAEDCEDCEGIVEYKEQIMEEIALTGGLMPQDRQRLLRVSRYCPVHKILKQGVEVQLHLAENL